MVSVKYHSSVFIPTDRFYSEPLFEAYHQAKEAHLWRVDSRYNVKLTRDKWTFLIGALASSLRLEDMPHQKHNPEAYYECEEYRQILRHFKTSREQTSSSQFNLSLDQCVGYFEDFYFLYTTTDEQFKLTRSAKKSLLQSIDEAIGTCETGINGRFYTALQDHQKETDWIQNELAKARYEALRYLQGQYVVEHKIRESMNVHVYNKMVQLANKNRLGIAVTVKLLDIHQGGLNTHQLETYFYKHYPLIFDAYEKEVKTMLTNHYLSELASVLSINNNEWETGIIQIPADKTTIMQNSIDLNFEGVVLPGVLDKLGQLSEDCTFYNVYSKQCVGQVIGDLVTQKLIFQKYYERLDDVEQNHNTYQNLRLKTGVKLGEIITIYQALKQQDTQKLHHAMHQFPLVLNNYPELILSQIKVNPAILSMVPGWLRTDARFIEEVIESLDQMLCDAIARQDEAEIRSTTAYVFNLIQSDYSYLKQLSKTVYENPTFADILLKKNSLFIGYLSELLQQDESLGQRVQRTHPHVLLGTEKSKGWLDRVIQAQVTLFEALPDEFKIETDLKPFGMKTLQFHSNLYPEAMFQFIRIEAFNHLLCQDKISIGFFTEQVDRITPDLLEKIIEYRKKQNKSPLPLFNMNAVSRSLRQFNHEIKTQLDADWSRGYLFIKTQACKYENFGYMNEPYRTKGATTYLSKTNSWFTGLIQYHAYQSSLQKKISRLIKAAWALCYLALPIIKIGIILALVVSIIWMMDTAIAPAVEIVNFGQAMGLFDFELKPLFNSLKDAFDGVCAVFEIALGLFSFLHWTNKCAENSLEETCDHVLFRLDSIDETSAQEKGAILKALRSHIQTELITSPENSFKDYIDIQYPIHHHGREYSTSFSEVASKRRSHFGGFSLEPQSALMGFFCKRTTTEKLLASVDKTDIPQYT